MTEATRIPGGLRELKRRRTYEAIQRAAMALFRERGYAATTMEQVAASAEVSPSTVFRYFPTKSDLVVTDAWDDLMRESLRRQPAEVPFHAAFGAAIREAFEGVTEADLEFFTMRQRLAADVPEVRAAMLEGVLGAAVEIEGYILERRLDGHPEPERLRAEAHALASAIVGVLAVEAMSHLDQVSIELWERVIDSVAAVASRFDV